MCLIYYDMLLDLGDQYVDIMYNNSTHITNVETQVGMLDMHTLLIYPCLMILDKYDAHTVSMSSYMYKIYDCPFHQNFYFAHCGFGIYLFRYQSHYENKDEWIFLADMQRSQPHMNFYCVDILFSWGEIMLLSIT